MDKKARYNSLSFKVAIGSDYLFSRVKRLSFKEVLTQYSRDRITKLAVLLNREYVNHPAIMLCKMLDLKDFRKVQIRNAITQFFETEAYDDVDYVAAFETTSLELLRRAYSIPVSRFDANDHPKSVDKLQYATVRLITQINEALMSFHIKDDKQSDAAILTYTNEASYYDILHFDQKNDYLYQLTQAVTFFRLLESKPEYDCLLDSFCKQIWNH